MKELEQAIELLETETDCTGSHYLQEFRRDVMNEALALLRKLAEAQLHAAQQREEKLKIELAIAVKNLGEDIVYKTTDTLASIPKDRQKDGNDCSRIYEAEMPQEQEKQLSAANEQVEKLKKCPECKGVDSDQCICAGSGTVLGAYYTLKGRIERTFASNPQEQENRE
jgi:hypothetical protein